MRVAVYAKPSLNDSPVKAKLFAALDAEEGFDVQSVSEVNASITADRLLVFGGDGTMLYAAKNSPVPVLGVNLGNTGFLAELEADVSPAELFKVLRSDEITERFMLTSKNGENSAVALNEVTIKSTNARPVRIKLYINGEFVDSYHSDGVIISTPTGSTAYSLSAGGPVLEPALQAIVINPVCPHSLHSRPLVIDADSNVSLELVDGSSASVIIDGEVCSSIPDGGTVSVCKASRTAKFVVADGKNFYKKLLQKMNRWGITR